MKWLALNQWCSLSSTQSRVPEHDNWNLAFSVVLAIQNSNIFNYHRICCFISFLPVICYTTFTLRFSGLSYRTVWWIDVTGMEVVCSSEMLVPIYQTTRCYNPEGHSMIFHLRENLHSLMSLTNILPKQHLLFRKLVLSFKTLTRKGKESSFISNVTNFLFCCQKELSLIN